MSKAKRTKWYIIEKTAEIFNKKGFSGTSLTDMTSATKLTKGSIYGNFENKEEVAVAAFNHNYQNLIKRFTRNLNEEKTAKGKLLTFLKTYEDAYHDIVMLGGCPILNNAVDSDDTNATLNSLSVKAFNDWNNNIHAIISQGKSGREIKDTIDANYYADLFIATIEGGLAISKSTGDKRYFDHAIQHLREVVETVF